MSTPRVFTLDDIWALRDLTSLAVSPDGRRVVFELQGFVREQDTNRSTLHLLHLDEYGHAQGGPRSLTLSTKSATAPVWAPDNRRLLFLSDREGEYPQLWLIDTDGGEACQLTNMLYGVQEAAWSPDGGWITFAAYADPERNDDELLTGRASLDDEARQKRREQQRYRLHTTTDLDYRRDGRGYFDTFSHLFLLSAPSGTEPAPDASVRRLTSGRYEHTQPAWTPDSLEISFLSNRHEDRFAGNCATDLWVLNIETGEERCLTEGDLEITCYSWSPDGQAALAVGEQRKKLEHSLARLYLITRQGNSGDHPLCLTPDLDLTTAPLVGNYFGTPGPYRPQWSTDSQQVYFLAAERGHVNLYHLDIVWRTLTQLSQASAITFLALLSGERGLILTREDATRPFELYHLPLTEQGAGEPTRLTSLYENIVRDYHWPVKEKFSFEGANGDEIDGWLVYPLGAREGVRYPLAVEVHGGPHWAYGDGLDPFDAYLAGRGFAVFYCNPHGSTGHGEAFLRSVLGDWGGKDFEDIMRGVDACIARGVADPERLAITGYSYGGYMSMYAIGHTERFKAAVPCAGVSNLTTFIGTSDIGYRQIYEIQGYPWDEERQDYYRERSPLNAAARVTAPTRFIHPENDRRCPIGQSEEFYTALKLMGNIPVELVRMPGAWHGGTPKPSQALAMWASTLEWFERYIDIRPEEYDHHL
ncbi:S9 family peptidase [Ktedonospora formicarum]|uniref:Putative peptidase YuxL n=1 Tax=Ktedonospora formicarum TaxID=2778364 RepID=A0A8J3ID09_9CHLR|nr:S9 family peptidase [Ktedonospora formicarum]GHO50013.1 putative peptidase YuxL [Ktedonospora formicarum]